MIKLIYPKFWSNNGLIPRLLTPLSWIYQLLTSLRKNTAKTIKLNAKVICVGNITVGGTGKTQIVELLAQHYKSQKYKVLIITKGYGSSLVKAKIVQKEDNADTVGDESKLLSEITQVVAAKNIYYALPYINEIQPQIIIFDDGLQNPYFYKDYRIIVVDNMRNLGNNKIFPAGPLREKADSAIKNSHAIITIGEQKNNDVIINKEASKHCKPIFYAKIKLTFNVKNKDYLAFTAIGNPEKFFSSLVTNGAKVKLTRSFPDHYQFSNKEIGQLKTIAIQNNYHLITTKKDYVKIINRDNIECALVTIELEEITKLITLINHKLKLD